MLTLQRCGACGTWQYPARDACRACLSDALGAAQHPGFGAVLASAVVRRTLDPAWEARLPLRVVTVKLDGGPHLLAFGAAQPGARVVVRREDALFYAAEV